MCKKIEIMDITPEWANTILSKNNTNNRLISPKHVSILAEEMAGGSFQDNGDTIRFSTDGTLLDGQHRLAAVVKSGVTLKNAIVVFGLGQDSIKSIDNGRKRTNADRLKILGISQSTRHVAAASKGYVQYMNGDLLFTSPVPDSLILDTVKEKSDFFTQGTIGFRKIQKNGLRPPAMCIFLLALCYEYNKETTEQFVDGVSLGENIHKGDPRYTLRNAMICRPLNLQWKKYMFAQYFIKTINAFFKKEEMKLLRFTPEREKFQELFFTNVITNEARVRLDEFSKKLVSVNDE